MFTKIETPAAANTDAAPKNDQFIVGEVYGTRSFCDYDCIFRFRIVKRTEKTVTIVPVWGNGSEGDEVRRKVRISGGVETIDPHGRYSMSPVLDAHDLGK